MHQHWPVAVDANAISWPLPSHSGHMLRCHAPSLREAWRGQVQAACVMFVASERRFDVYLDADL
jgi:hypothetical protein